MERFNSEKWGSCRLLWGPLAQAQAEPCQARLTEDLLVQARCECRVQSLAKSSHIPNTSDLCALFLNIPSERPCREVKLAHFNLLPKLRFIFWKRRYFPKCINWGGGGITFIVANQEPPVPSWCFAVVCSVELHWKTYFWCQLLHT